MRNKEHEITGVERKHVQRINTVNGAVIHIY